MGRIEGDDVAVKGQLTLVRDGTRKAAELASGSEVTVRSGQARLVLADGSEMDICGPAQFSLLQSGGALTVALNYGRVHARTSAELPLVIYTPLVVATPLSVGGRPRDFVVGLEANAAMCVRSVYGAVRLEQQLTAGSVVVPQNGEVLLPDGLTESLRDAPGECRCDVVLVEDRQAPEPARVVTTADAGSAGAQREKKEGAPAKEVPQWTVVLPPLVFDASAPPPTPPPSPEVMLLVREARVQPLVLRGRVEARVPEGPGGAQKKPGLGSRIKSFFRRLFGRK